MQTNIRKIAETLADEIQQGEQQAAVEARHLNNMWWRRILKREGLDRLWRKAIVSQILIEEQCN